MYAGLRDGRLHDARHTAATVLPILGVPERGVIGLMGWSTTGMAAHYLTARSGVTWPSGSVVCSGPE
jgi:hypothetical protein